MASPTLPLTRHPPFRAMPVVTRSDRVRPDGRTEMDAWLSEWKWIDQRGCVVAIGYELPDMER